jgi:hypothetical protein
VPGSPEAPVVWHQDAAPAASWREFLLDACPERRDLVHGDLLHGNVLVSPDARRAEPGALLDAAARHHCYELHIGFTHLGWNVWTGNQADLAATARRLAEVLERGPVVSSVLHQLLTHPT